MAAARSTTRSARGAKAAPPNEPPAGAAQAGHDVPEVPAPPSDPWPAITRGFAGAPSDLVPVLQRTQEVLGYLSPDSIARIARWLKLSQNEVFGVATFYAQFRFTPPGRHRLRVCLGTACHVKGGVQMLETLERRLDVRPGETTPDGEFGLERVACLGCCALAPVVTIDDSIYGQMSVLKLQELLGDGHA
jgi:NADH-quinone oxidoreductase subunit E